MLLIGLALKDNDLGRARRLLARHEPRPGTGLRRLNPDGDLRDWEWRYFHGLAQGDELFTLPGGSMAFLSPDQLIALDPDNAIPIWDLNAKRRTQTHRNIGNLSQFTVSPGGRFLAGTDDARKRVTVWNLAPLAPVFTAPVAIHNSARGRNVGFLDGGERLVFIDPGPKLVEGTNVMVADLLRYRTRRPRF